MGMPAAFSFDADFSGMDGTRNLYISDILHKAFVAVDEAGLIYVTDNAYNNVRLFDADFTLTGRSARAPR